MKTLRANAGRLGLCVLIGVLAAGPAAAQNPNQQAAQQQLQQWDEYTTLFEVAQKCPVVEDWKMYALEAARKRREANLKQLGVSIDLVARQNEARALVTPLNCDDAKLAPYIAEADKAYAAAFLDLGGWYGYRARPCYVQEVPPARVMAEQNALVAKYPDLKGLYDFWKGQTDQVRDAQCPNDNWREAYVGDMLFWFNLGTSRPKDAPPVLSMGFPALDSTTGLTARRQADPKTPPAGGSLAVDARAGQAYQVNADWGYAPDGSVVGVLAPYQKGQKAYGVELRVYDAKGGKLLKTFKPVRELAPVPSTEGAGVDPARRWQFGPEVDAEIMSAPAGAVMVMAADMDNGAGREFKEWTVSPLGPYGNLEVFWKIGEIRKAKSWAFTRGPLGAPLTR